MRTTLVEDLKELADHEDRWEALRHEAGGTIFSSNMMVRTWLSSYRGSVRSRVVLIEDEGELVAAAPLAVHVHRAGGMPIKVLSLAGGVTGKLYLGTNSVLCRPGREDALEALMNEIKKMGWSLLNSVNMLDSWSSRAYRRMVAERWHEAAAPLVKMYTVTMPDSGDIVDLFSKNSRRNIRKDLKHLRDRGCQITFRNIPAEDVPRAVDTYAREHIERWGPKGGSYFRDPENVEFLSTIVREALSRRCGFAREILIDGEVAAQNFGFMEGGTEYSYRVGMNNAFTEHSPGWLIKVYGLEAARSSGIRQHVLGVGNEEHKSHMGGAETTLVGIRASRGLLSAAMALSSAAGALRNGRGPAR